MTDQKHDAEPEDPHFAGTSGKPAHRAHFRTPNKTSVRSGKSGAAANPPDAEPAEATAEAKKARGDIDEAD